MGKIHFVLVCHCDRVEWSDSAYSYDDMEFAVRQLTRILVRIERECDVEIPVTYLPCFMHGEVEYSVAHERTGLFMELSKKGNEIGVHTHVGYDQLPSQDGFIIPDADALEGLGFPRPKTWAAGDWYTTSETVRQLEEGRYTADCSVVPLEGKFYHGSRKQFELNYSRCKNLSPYHPSYEDICITGESSIVELPVNGWLPELYYWDQHFPLGEKRLEERLLYRLRMRGETAIDIFQVFWHPQDFWLPHYAWYPGNSGQEPRIDKQLLKSTQGFLRLAAGLDGVEFSTAYQAAEEWERSNSS